MYMKVFFAQTFKHNNNISFLMKIELKEPPYLCPNCKTPMKKRKWPFSDKYGLECPECKLKIGKALGQSLAEKL